MPCPIETENKVKDYVLLKEELQEKLQTQAHSPCQGFVSKSSDTST